MSNTACSSHRHGDVKLRSDYSFVLSHLLTVKQLSINIDNLMRNYLIFHFMQCGKSIIAEGLPCVRYCSGCYNGHKRGKRQLLQSMFSTGSSSQGLGEGQVKFLNQWNQERPYLADGKRVDFEEWVGIQQAREGIPVGGNSRSIVIEVKCLDFSEGIMSCLLLLDILVTIILVASDGSTTQTSGATEKSLLVCLLENLFNFIQHLNTMASAFNLPPVLGFTYKIARTLIHLLYYIQLRSTFYRLEKISPKLDDFG